MKNRLIILAIITLCTVLFWPRQNNRNIAKTKTISLENQETMANDGNPHQESNINNSRQHKKKQYKYINRPNKRLTPPTPKALRALLLLMFGRPDNALLDPPPLEEITFLNFSGGDISNDDLRLLSLLPNLNTLYLSGTQVSDISALSKLPNLKYLNLNQTQVSDISALSELTNLKDLSLDETQVSEVQLKKLKKSLPHLSIDIQKSLD